MSGWFLRLLQMVSLWPSSTRHTLARARSVLRTPSTPWDILENTTANSMVKVETQVTQNNLVKNSRILRH